MKLNRILYLFLLMCGSFITAQTETDNFDILNSTFQLGGVKSGSNQFFICQTEVKTFNPDGVLAAKDKYILFLKYITDGKTNKPYYECSRFLVLTNDTIIKTVPSLAGWTYTPHLGEVDENNYVFGIDHKIFDNLIDNSNMPFAPEYSYLIYNTFIDFHSFCDVFAAETPGLTGIQNLHKIGDKIIHYASNTKPPVNLGNNVKEGSYFENGEITLELMGLSKTNGKTAVIVHYDSGESSFNMIIEPMPNMIIKTVGRSHYFGDIYLDPNTKWVQKVFMAEVVISQTKLPFPPNQISSTIERQCNILNVSKTEFERQLKIN